MEKPLKTLLAIKALSLDPDLTANDRRVGTALIEHFNRRTSRCDPSINRLSELLSVCSRTVIRSTGRLEKAGLFRKVRHGGYSNRNSYEPIWARFSEIQERWAAQMRRRSSDRAGVSSVASQECHPDGDSRAPQTLRANLSKQTCLQGLPRKETEQDTPSIPATGSPPKNPDHPSRLAAERRWSLDVHHRFSGSPVTYGEVIGAIDETLRVGATDAELKSRGGGLEYLLARLKLKDG